MITLNYGHLNNKEFIGVIAKLDNFTGWNNKKVRKFNKLKKALDTHSIKLHSKISDLVLENAEKTEVDGKSQVKMDESGSRPVIKDEEKVNGLYQQILQTSFQVEGLSEEDLAEVNFSPREYRAAECICSKGEEENGRLSEDSGKED